MKSNKAQCSLPLTPPLMPGWPGVPSGPDLMDLGIASWRLWSDAAAVVWLRSSAIAHGGAPAAREAQRMVTEKLEANAAFAADMAIGSIGMTPLAMANSALGHYGPKVRANRRRLTRGR